jgi:hypothetical protein
LIEKSHFTPAILGRTLLISQKILKIMFLSERLDLWSNSRTMANVEVVRYINLFQLFTKNDYEDSKIKLT